MTLSFHQLLSAYLSGDLSHESASALEQVLDRCDGQLLLRLASRIDLAALLHVVEMTLRRSPPGAKADILASVFTTAQNRLASSDYTTIRAGENWFPFLVPGTYTKALFNHPCGVGHRMFALKMDAGVHFPEHAHAGFEECFLLSGDLSTEGEELLPGDYLRARPGSHHTGLSTRGGCICLMVLSRAS